MYFVSPRSTPVIGAHPRLSAPENASKYVTALSRSLVPREAGIKLRPLSPLGRGMFKRSRSVGKASICRAGVETTRGAGDILVEVRDDGPAHARGEPPGTSSGLGLQIIRTLVTEDLEGEFDLAQEDGWMCARVRFPQRVGEA